MSGWPNAGKGDPVPVRVVVDAQLAEPAVFMVRKQSVGMVPEVPPDSME